MTINERYPFGQKQENMNNELRDPLEKVSNSLRRAVIINKSKDTDLRTTMNTIQRERRRSFNTWSLRQEKFLRAKQNLVPAMLFDQARQRNLSKKTDDSQQDKPRERRITLVRAVAPVSLATANRSNSPDLKLPSIAEHKKDERRKKKSTPGVLPPVITLAISSQFFQESKRTRRISDHTSRHQTQDYTQERVKRDRKFSNITGFASDAKQRIHQSNAQHKRTAVDVTADDAIHQPMQNIMEERNTNSQGSDRSLKKGDLIPAPNTTDNDEGNERAKGQWKKVRDSLGKITGKKRKTDINKLSMMELTKLFEEIRECRYLRVGNQSSFTAERANHTGTTCKCLACTVKDKNKLKNHLSAPE